MSDAFIAECVLAGFNTEIHMAHNIKHIDQLDNIVIDIYYWKYFHVKEIDGEYMADKENPYYKLIADVHFMNISDCKCYNYSIKTAVIQSDRRHGHPSTESMISLLNEFVDMLSSSHFDKLTGSFTKNESKEKHEECCVCLELTETKTNCNHHLCIPCWNQLKNERCPICRREDIHSYCKFKDE